MASIYSITLWKGDATGPLSDYDIRYEIGKNSPRDAGRVFERILDNMQFIGLMDKFFKDHPCKITLLGSAEGMMIPKIERVIDAYKKAASGLGCKDQDPIMLVERL